MNGSHKVLLYVGWLCTIGVTTGIALTVASMATAAGVGTIVGVAYWAFLLYEPKRATVMALGSSLAIAGITYAKVNRFSYHAIVVLVVFMVLSVAASWMARRVLLNQ